MNEKKENSSEKRVYGYIKNKIITKELFPGTQLIESHLASATGVSRTPIREALKKLSYEGIVNIIPNRGAFIASPSYAEICSVYECKKVIEAAAIRKACTHVTDEDLMSLEKLIEAQVVAHKEHNLTEYLRLNDAFHMLIAKQSGNPLYEKYMKELTDLSNVYLIFYDNFIISKK